MNSSHSCSFKPLADYLEFRGLSLQCHPREKLIVLHRILSKASTWYLQQALLKDWNLWKNFEPHMRNAFTNRHDGQFAANDFHLTILAALRINRVLLKDPHSPISILESQNRLIDNLLERLNRLFLQG